MAHGVKVGLRRLSEGGRDWQGSLTAPVPVVAALLGARRVTGADRKRQVPGWRALGLGDGVHGFEAILNIHHKPGGDTKSHGLPQSHRPPRFTMSFLRCQ